MSTTLVSEFVEGITLADLMTARRPAVRDAAELVAALADALQYAHDQGIVHRDVKPSNIMIGDDGISRLMDFGLAKRDAGEITMTLDGQVLGTPAYMSPEQAKGEAHSVDGRSDLYSLGVILYELLTGELPFRGNSRMLLHQVLHDEPQSPRRLNDRIPRDLETICLKAMAKEPGRRYHTARELADELRRFLKGQPIQARPVSKAERLWRWCRRNPVLAMSGSIAGAALVAVAVVSVLYAMDQRRNADEVRQEKEKTAHALNQSAQFRAALELDHGLSYCDWRHTHLGWLWLAHSLEIAPEQATDLRAVLRVNLAAWHPYIQPTGQMPTSEPSKVGAIPDSLFEPRHTWSRSGDREQLLLAALSWKPQRTETSDMDDPARDGFFPVRIAQAVPEIPITQPSAELAAVAAGSAPAAPTFGGAAAAPPAARQQQAITAQPSATFVATRDMRKAGIDFRQLAGERPIGPQLEHQGKIIAMSFSSDGKSVFGVVSNGVQRWATDTGKPIGLPLARERGAVLCAALSLDNRTIITGSEDHFARLWTVSTGKRKGQLIDHAAKVSVVALKADSTLALTAGGNAARIWNTITVEEVGHALQHDGTILAAAFSPDGKYVLTGSQDHTARVWEASTGKPVGIRLQHRKEVLAVAFSPDGSMVITGCRDGTARVWALSSGEELGSPLFHDDDVLSIAFSPDGRVFLTGCADNTARLWDAATRRPIGPRFKLTDKVQVVAFTSAQYLVGRLGWAMPAT